MKYNFLGVDFSVEGAGIGINLSHVHQSQCEVLHEMLDEARVNGNTNPPLTERDMSFAVFIVYHLGMKLQDLFDTARIPYGIAHMDETVALYLAYRFFYILLRIDDLQDQFNDFFYFKDNIDEGTRIFIDGEWARCGAKAFWKFICLTPYDNVVKSFFEKGWYLTMLPLITIFDIVEGTSPERTAFILDRTKHLKREGEMEL